MAVNILIVDDSLPMRAVIKKTIKASGYGAASFFEADDGRQALDILQNQWLDIVVTDYNMPDMDGMTLLANLKADDLLASIPVLVITTEGSRQKEREFMEKGAAGYIKKPFTPEEIRNKLKQILGDIDEPGDLGESDEDLDF
ncbi:MAG: response regulator [Thermodesulfobacteriota bacterium]|nr:response regulator [Thermodesulfobacteriota bacterium]